MSTTTTTTTIYVAISPPLPPPSSTTGPTAAATSPDASAPLPQPPPRLEKITFTNDCTPAELRGALLAAAEISDSDAEGVVLRLTAGDEGSTVVLTVGPGLPGNTEAGAYKLEVLQNKLVAYEALGGAAERLLATTAGVETREIEELRRAVEQLKTKLGRSGTHSGNAPARRRTLKAARANARYLTSPKYVLTPETAAYLREPSFDNWQFDGGEILCLLEHMFHDMGLVKAFGIEIPTLRRFLGAIKDCYNENPFHNFRHCFCVTQMMYGILHTTGIVEKLRDIDKLILILSCIGHDLDHPGFNNAYQINAMTDLAIIYNDASPLENHHAAVLFTILFKPAFNILSSLPDATYREVRRSVIRCILATDMARHGEIMNAFKKASEAFSYDDAEHRLLLLQVVVKCADISNETKSQRQFFPTTPVRPTDVSEPWVELLLAEFFHQSDTEKSEGLPYAPFMDREKVTKAGAQIGFIQYVMVPLYDLAAKVIPGMEEAIIRPIRESLAYYKAMQDKEAAVAAGGK
ncbi:high affinity cGMP-specific 3',5'-cyclic phosphodiesterase 9A [Zopfochytrium polystomum]|nr:high affinity cGMP-specific 3',5'-cyclic phosphodiesterase 9A [Zopfochytrium polystomum]